LRQILRLTPLVMISSWLFPINGLINGAIANNHNSAYFVELSSANTIFIVLTGMFILSVTNVMFPKLSREIARNENKEEFSKVLSTTLSGMMFILLPMAVGIYFLRVPIVRIIYEGGEFSAYATERTSFALGILSIGIIGYGLTTILSRALFADKDGKTPAIITIIAIIINIAIALIFTNALGIGGPALATAVSISVAGFGMYAVAIKKYRIFDTKQAANFIKMILATGVMFVVIYFVQPLLVGMHDIFEIAIITTTGVLIYAVGSAALKINEAQTAKGMILSRIRRSANE
ncbi:MAG: polysaccharide biosynthesis C-terminal domain-containing protein, partial [Defluviitaleaceae bacterium]|nr:polysaccharide biosynthesis C-terminal domain-containing protein [Defluviitaleaceae bacterium]